jgi:hypothetical protein
LFVVAASNYHENFRKPRKGAPHLLIAPSNGHYNLLIIKISEMERKKEKEKKALPVNLVVQMLPDLCEFP